MSDEYRNKKQKQYAQDEKEHGSSLVPELVDEKCIYGRHSLESCRLPSVFPFKGHYET